MKFDFEIRWNHRDRETEDINPDLFRLLRSIREKGSLRSAAEVLNISYRHAWGLIRHWSARLSTPIVILEKGRGARLAETGEKLLWAEHLVTSRISPDLESLADEINNELQSLVNVKKKQDKLRICASHGLAIAQLQTLLSDSGVFDLDFHFRGSLESLRELANSNCDVAGFHFPQGKISTNLVPIYNQWLDEKKHLLMHVSTRQQGLIVNKKNPHKIKTLKDLTRRSVRFVNRQPDSGTRTIFDELLKHEQINKFDIKGYHDEEFTHIAVAALVASGAADAGFGIKAAASKFNLQFIPMIIEDYVLAINKTLPAKSVTELKNILKSRQFKTRVHHLPGYNVKNAGEEMSLHQIFNNKKNRHK